MSHYLNSQRWRMIYEPQPEHRLEPTIFTIHHQISEEAPKFFIKPRARLNFIPFID